MTRDKTGYAVDLDAIDDQLWRAGQDLDWFEPGSHAGPKPKKLRKKASRVKKNLFGDGQ